MAGKQGVGRLPEPALREAPQLRGLRRNRLHDGPAAPRDLVSLLMLSGTDALRGACHQYLQETPLYHTQGATCGADMAELTAGLAGREPSFLGHDGCDKYVTARKIIAAAGLPEAWGRARSAMAMATFGRTRKASWPQTSGRAPNRRPATATKFGRR